MHFKARVGQKLADVRLQQNLKILSQRWTVGRAQALTELDDFEATRDEAVARRNRALHRPLTPSDASDHLTTYQNSAYASVST